MKSLPEIVTTLTTVMGKILSNSNFCYRCNCNIIIKEISLYIGERSNIIWRLGRGFAQTVKVPSCGKERSLAKSSYNFYSGQKKLILQFIFF